MKYFNSLQAWRLDAEGENQTSATDMAPLDGLSEPGWIADDKEDDLPF